eukprot:gene5358-5410_t
MSGGDLLSHKLPGSEWDRAFPSRYGRRNSFELAEHPMNINLILKRASRLDAFSGYPFRTLQIGRAPGGTTDTQEVRPSRSRAALMGEQPNPWDLLQPQDATSRHRGAKPCRRYGLLGKISLLSPGQPPQLNYPPDTVPDPDNGPRLETQNVQSGISMMTPRTLACRFKVSHLCYTKRSEYQYQDIVKVPGQFSSRYAIRAGRNLPDKEFRYLRMVIVTTAVYWGLSSQLRLAANHRLRLFFAANSRHGSKSLHANWPPFSRSYGVGFGYGPFYTSLEDFLGSIGSFTSPFGSASGLRQWNADLPTFRPTPLPQDNHRLVNQVNPVFLQALSIGDSPWAVPTYPGRISLAQEPLVIRWTGSTAGFLRRFTTYTTLPYPSTLLDLTTGILLFWVVSLSTTKLIPRRLTATLSLTGIRSLADKHVTLHLNAFRGEPAITNGFGPPYGLTRTSTWPWIDHLASGLDAATMTPYSDSLSLRLPLDGHAVTEQVGSNGLYANGFRIYFTPLSGLSGWSRQIHTGLHESGVSPSVPDFPTSFIYISNFLLIVTAAAVTIWSHDPEHATPAGLAHIRFSLFRFRSPLLTESRLFSLPVGTEMFHFPTFPLSALYIQAEIMGHDSHWVPPFGNPRIEALLAAPRGFSQPHTTFFGFWSLVLKIRAALGAGNLEMRTVRLLTKSRGFVPSGPNNVHEEVIQPHLPVRLPCYDFVPITDPTLGSSLLAVGPLTLGVTDFRDVTGGVYKPRERIHRSVADLRLLATPTS